MSGTMTLIIDRRATSLRAESGTVRIDFDDGAFDRIPPQFLESVVIHGSPQLDAAVLRLLSRNNVPLFVAPVRKSDTATWAAAGLSSFAHRRLAQYRAYIEPETRVDICREIVREKLASHLQQAHVMALPDTLADEIETAMEQLPTKLDCDALRGVEGHIGRRWYGALKDRIDPIWGFSGRNRRPPTDPVNAFLSLSYTLATSVSHKTVTAAGYDPALGFLHAPAPARASLALDLVEPLRPQVDTFVLSCLANFEPGDFSFSD